MQNIDCDTVPWNMHEYLYNQWSTGR